MPKLETLAEFELAEVPSVTIGTDDLVSVHMPDGRHYEVTEILTIDARSEGVDCRVMHTLTIGESYYHRGEKEAA